MFRSPVQGAPPRSVSWASIAANGRHPQTPNQRAQQQARPAIKSANQPATVSQKRMQPTPPTKPPGLTFNYGSDPELNEIASKPPRQAIHTIYLTLKVDKAVDRNDEPYLKGISANLQAETITAVNAILSLSTDDVIKTPLGVSDVAALPMQTFKHSVMLSVKVKSPSQAKIDYLRDHIIHKEAGVLNIKGLPGVKYAPAVICNGRPSNPALVLGFMTSHSIHPPLAMALITKSFKGFPVSWIAEIDGNDLLNGQGPTGPVDVSLGSCPPVVNPDIRLLGLVIPDDMVHERIKSGTRDQGGWHFQLDKLKSPTNPSGSVTITVLARSPVVERDPAPPPAPTAADVQASIGASQLAHANILIGYGLDLAKQAPTSDTMSDEDSMPHETMKKAAALAEKACNLGNEMKAMAAENSSLRDKALASSHIHTVDKISKQLEASNKVFETKCYDLVEINDEAAGFLKSFPIHDNASDLLLATSAHREGTTEKAYSAIMRGLCLLLPLIYKVKADNYEPPELDVQLHLQYLKKAKDDKSSKSAKTAAGQTAGSPAAGGAVLPTPNQ